MRLFDDKKMIEITMREWDDRYNEATPDWSNDFFEAGGLEFDEERNAYRVDDVDYCVDQAHDWMNAEGDFSDDEIPEYIDRQVFVEDI